MAVELQQRTSVVVGLGATGLSCVRYLVRNGVHCTVVDSRDQPPGLEQLKKEFPDIRVELGGFNQATLLQASELIVSPGVSLQTTEIANAVKAGVPVTGDIDIFSRLATAPIVAVTGSNGKSTVVAVLAEILRTAGKRVAVGGNLDAEFGKPALDLLEQGDVDFYVLELSSFQLETTACLQAEVAVILNISEDHMDRYASMDEYIEAKQRIFRSCRQAVVNRDSADSMPVEKQDIPIREFGFNVTGEQGVGIREIKGKQILYAQGHPVVAVDELKVVGQHNVANVMAAVTLARALGVDFEPISEAVRCFPGLPHRCQWVATHHGVEFYNDSKGTNVGATVAAVEGLGQRLNGRIVLIAGGVGKGADFGPLAPVLQKWCRQIVLIGEAAATIAEVLDGSPVCYARDMQDAVQLAFTHAESGDAVLLSPACASFDMFENFKQRGDCFVETVRALK